MQVLAGVQRAHPAVAGPELRHRDLVVGRPARGEPPRRLQRGEPHHLGVDVGVGGALPDRLEGRDRLAELLALDRVLGGHRRALPGTRRPPPSSARPSCARRRSWTRSCGVDRRRRPRRRARRPRSSVASGSRLVVCELGDGARRRRRGVRARGPDPSPNSAGTATTSASAPYGHERLSRPVNVQPSSPSRVGGDLALEGRRQDRGAVGDPAQKAGAGTVLREHVRRDERRHGRHGRDRPADLLEHQRDLEKAETGAALLLRHGDPGDAGLGEPAPQVAVEHRPAAGLLGLRLQRLEGSWVARSVRIRRARSCSANWSSVIEKSMRQPPSRSSATFRVVRGAHKTRRVALNGGITAGSGACRGRRWR